MAVDDPAPTLRTPFETGYAVSMRFRRVRSEEHTSELQSLTNLVCRLLLEKKNRQAHAEVSNEGRGHGYDWPDWRDRHLVAKRAQIPDHGAPPVDPANRRRREPLPATRQLR